MRYKVNYFPQREEDQGEVLEHFRDTNDPYSQDEWILVFQGSLAECDAYIRLHENKYIR